MIKEHPVYFGYGADEEGNFYSSLTTGRFAKITDKFEIRKPAINRTGYFFTHMNRYKKNIEIHRLVWECFNGLITKGLSIDHINRIRTDNSLKNLRLATIQQQRANCCKFKRKCSSKYKGVYFNKGNSKWMSRCKGEFIGYFETELEAAKAYDEVAYKYGYTTNRDLKLL